MRVSEVLKMQQLSLFETIPAKQILWEIPEQGWIPILYEADIAVAWIVNDLIIQKRPSGEYAISFREPRIVRHLIASDS